ncbi:25937_t:CDS:2, partial [Racocetra persica]
LAQDDDVIVGIELSKLYIWDFKTGQYKMILNKNGQVTKNYRGGIYVHYGDTYENMHKLSVKNPKRRGKGHCCYREHDEIKENKFSDLELYQMMLFGVMSSIADKFPDLSKNKIPKIPVDEEFEDAPKTPIKEEPDVEKMEVEFPKLNVVEEIIRILKSMEDEMNINNLEDRNNWNQVIQYFDWSILPNNYQQMTQLYRITLYYKKMLERVSTNLQITYEYTQTILITNNIKSNTEEDII